MTYDSLMLRRMVAEINELAGARVQRVFPTSRQEIVLELALRAPLPQIVINVSADAGRAHRDDDREPALGADTPLADVLRRHLRGATLLSARQVQFDRVLCLEFANAEGMGPGARRTLVAEVMGRLSNLLLLDERDFILECSRHVTTRVNRVRESLPGEAYAAVPDFGKLDPTTATPAALAARWPDEPALLTAWVRQTLQGASDVLLAVLLDRLGLPEDATTAALPDPGGPDQLLSALQALINAAEQPGPAHVGRRGQQRPVAYPVALPHGWEVLGEEGSLSAACRSLAHRAAEAAELRQLRERLAGVLRAALEKVRRRESERAAALTKAERADEWRRRGEIILAHVWALEPGQSELVAEDWESGAEVTIPLDPRQTPQEQAQEQFRRYKKLQRVRERVPALLEQARTERQELEDLLDQVAEGELRDLRLVEEEMTGQGLLKAPRRRPTTKADYRSTETPEGYAVIYGRSALENAAVLRAARPDDLWLHVQGCPGGHVVIRTNNRPDEVPQSALMEAARLAARQSRRRRDTVVEVDVTLVKHLQHMRHGPPGHVVYREFRTLLVKP
ncbi:NFACT family protein [bacterium]|nr:NFACT family protein [bacterium]